MSEINVRLKHNFEDSDKLFRILFAAIKIGKPASKRKIADVADVSSQLVDYHICLLYTSPSPREKRQSRMTSSA